MIGTLWRMLATGIPTGNSMCLLDQSCPRESGPARQAHPQEEALYVAAGKVSCSTPANPYALARPTVTSRQTGGSYSVSEAELPHGLADQPHIHDQADEACYIFDGEFRVPRSR